MAYAHSPGHMLGVTSAYPSLTLLSGIDVEGDLEFLNQNCRGLDTHCRPSNLQMLHHHPPESYGPAMNNVPGYGISPPSPQLSTSSAVPNYPHNRPQSQPQHPILATVDVTGRGNMVGSGRGDVIGSLLRTRRCLIQTTSHPGSISPVRINANGVLKLGTGGC